MPFLDDDHVAFPLSLLPTDKEEMKDVIKTQVYLKKVSNKFDEDTKVFLESLYSNLSKFINDYDSKIVMKTIGGFWETIRNQNENQDPIARAKELDVTMKSQELMTEGAAILLKTTDEYKLLLEEMYLYESQIDQYLLRKE